MEEIYYLFCIGIPIFAGICLAWVTIDGIDELAVWSIRRKFEKRLSKSGWKKLN